MQVKLEEFLESSTFVQPFLTFNPNLKSPTFQTISVFVVQNKFIHYFWRDYRFLSLILGILESWIKVFISLKFLPYPWVLQFTSMAAFLRPTWPLLFPLFSLAYARAKNGFLPSSTSPIFPQFMGFCCPFLTIQPLFLHHSRFLPHFLVAYHMFNQ